MTPSEVAEICGISERLVYEAIRSGELAAKRVGRRRWLILRESMLKWLGSPSEVK